MAQPDQVGRQENPFASHRTRPGALPFLFSDGASVEQTVNRLRDNRWRGQIVGHHGAGKSTFVAVLLPALKARGLEVRLATLHDRQQRLPRNVLRSNGSGKPMVLIIDGYEQLSMLSRISLRWACLRRGWGLIIATHRPAAWLPVLIKLAPQRELMERLFDSLLAGHVPLVDSHQARASFARHNGDLREVWFDLYDRYEREWRSNSPSVECCHRPIRVD